MPTHPAPQKYRRLLLRVMPALGLGTLALADRAISQDVLLKQEDADAVAIDYRSDANQVDRAKFPKFADGQSCRTCNLYYGDAGSTSGACGIVFGKVVLAAAWCSAWEKRP